MGTVNREYLAKMPCLSVCFLAVPLVACTVVAKSVVSCEISLEHKASSQPQSSEECCGGCLQPLAEKCGEGGGVVANTAT